MKRMILCLLLPFCIPTVFAGYENGGVISEYEGFVETFSGLLQVVGEGAADDILVRNSSRLQIHSTSIPDKDWYMGGILYIALYDNSRLDYYGGATFALTVRNDATVYLYGGRIDAIRSLQSSSSIKHITMVCDVDSVYYDQATRLLTGNWLDGSSFSITLVNVAPFDSTYSNIRFIPEPATMLLLGLGGLLLRRKNK